MTATFDISPEKRAGMPQFFYRQLFVKVPPVARRDADLTGKTAIVTGANGGLGLEAASQLLDLGASVILAVRNERKGEEAQRRLLANRQASPNAVQVWQLDLTSYDSILAFTERAKTLPNLNIAILNAGVYKYKESFAEATGFEEAFQTNYLSTMLLTILLLPILKAKKSPGGTPAHLCVISSDTGAWSKFTERSSTPLLPAFKQKMDSWNSDERYGTTKLLGQLFLSELAKHVSSSAVTINFANPGLCAGSDLGRELSGPFKVVYKIMLKLLARTSAEGARTYIHAVATLGEGSHGQYVEDAKIQPMAVLAYKPEGLKIATRLYDETLDELAFAGARNIVEGMAKGG